MSFIKKLKRIGLSIYPWGTLNRLEHGLEMIYLFLLSVFFHSNNFRTTCCLCLVEQVYVITNHYLNYQRIWRDREGQESRLHYRPQICRFVL